MAEELLPCPFCGGVCLAYRDADDSWFVGCPKDCAVVPDRPYRTWEVAIAVWNTRKETEHG